MPEKYFRNVEIDLDDLADAVIDWFEQDEFEVQDFQEGPSIYIQARKSSLLSTLSGTGKALNVRLSPLSRGFKVEVGPGDWLDKGIGAGVALATRFIFLPLAIGTGIATGYGIYQQLKLPEQLLDFVEAYVDRHGIDLETRELEERRTRRERKVEANIDEGDIEDELAALRASRGRTRPATTGAKTFCPECGAETSGGNFCAACGYDLRKTAEPKADE